MFRRNSILNLILNYSNIVYNLITGVFLVPFYLRKISLSAYGSFLSAFGIAGLIRLLEYELSMVMTQRIAKSYAQSEWTAFHQTTDTGRDTAVRSVGDAALYFKLCRSNKRAEDLACFGWQCVAVKR